MARKTITLIRHTDPQAALDAARAVLEARGYRWEPVGPGKARAYQGGGRISPRLMARRLLIGLTATDSRLVLHRESSGWGFGGPMGATMSMRISREFRRAGQAIHAALSSTSLAS